MRTWVLTRADAAIQARRVPHSLPLLDLSRPASGPVWTINGLYKWELIYPKRPRRGLEDVEFATLTYVDWFNNRRLHGEIAPGPGFTTPAAFDAAYHHQPVPAHAGEDSTN